MFISQLDGLFIFLTFSIIIILSVILTKTKHFNLDSFLLDNREIPWWKNGLSIAATWIWGPALFLSSMQAFKDGIPGVFWFLLPNFTCFFIFTYFATKFRKIMPNGYTLAEFMKQRYNGSYSVHISYIFLILLCQVTAIILNSVIGAALISLVTGIETNYAILAIVGIALTYSLISGFKASIFTDCVEIVIIYAFIFTVVPLSIFKTGGISTIIQNIGGIYDHKDIFDWNTIIYFAIPTFVTLWTGPITDQMFYQRVMGSKKNQVRKSFISAAFFYIVVPFSLSLLGFVGVELFKMGALNNYDEQLIGGIVVSTLFSKTILYFYCFMALAGLCSTIDSALCAASSVGCIDVYKTYIASNSSDLKKKHLLYISRLSMIIVSVIGLLIAFTKPPLIAIFFIIGTVRAAGCFPTIISMFSKKIPGYIIPFAIGSAIFVSLPLSIYANMSGSKNLVVFASLSAVFFPLFVCLLGIFIQSKFFRN